MISSELAPWAKTGGLADAVAGLSAALGRHGHSVVVLLPRYTTVRVRKASRLPVPAGTPYGLLQLQDDAPFRTVLLDAPQLFADAAIYTGDARDAARFIALCEAAERLPGALRWRPDIVHCHDWHAALVPAMTAHAASRSPCVLTLHNIGYQGQFAADVVDLNRHPELSAFIDDDGINFLKAGIAQADAITTVSPSYAREILTEEYAMGLQDVLRAREADLRGVLNGVDYGTWSPDTDPHIEQHYGRGDLAPKHEVKRKLLAATGLQADVSRPLIGIVTRLVAQKGIDLVTEALPTLLQETDAAFVVLGSGDPALAATLRNLSTGNPLRVSFREGYDEALAHKILAGSDFVLVPSRYEPCGLTQLYALRYGSIPIVRKTGGLADTIEHFDPATGVGNGCVFEHPDTGGLIWATRTALNWYRDPADFAQLVDNAMRADHSWDRRIGDYESLYAGLLGKR
jgi:starch synthase